LTLARIRFIVWRQSGNRPVSQADLADDSFVRIAAERMRAILADRERLLKRTLAWIAVALLHVLFVIAFMVAGRIHVRHLRTPQEISILLAPLPQARSTRPPEPTEPLEFEPLNVPPVEMPAIPVQPPTTRAPTGDALSLGRAIKCGAGSFEYLSAAEQHACVREPWRFKFDKHGTIVLDAPPPAELHLSPGDIQAHQRATADPCPILQNTPCIDKVIHGDHPW
jgi:hypothetical protein